MYTAICTSLQHSLAVLLVSATSRRSFPKLLPSWMCT